MAATASPANDYILIVSRDDIVTGRYAGVLEKKYETRLTTSLPAMHSCVASERPALLFIDPRVCVDNTTEFLISLIRKLSGIFVVIIENQSDRLVDQRSLFKAGARGFCKDDITPALLSRAVNLVLEGEYWIQRKLITQMISELASEGNAPLQHSNFDNSLVRTLTPRELQVARMVHLGGNNKMIARELDISERTVKAHLSAIFRKLEIENRLNLALFFSEIS
ncbi:MAG: response regulator transcription factor [Gammaproteobacteria bacterium]